MKKETIKTATTVIVGFGLAFLVVGTSPSFQACVNEHQNHTGGGPLQEHIGRLLTFYKVGRGCGGEWLHKHGEGVIALFTVILGIATWLLWRATKKLVEGAERTAERQLRAYVFVESSEVRNFGFDQPPEGWLTIKNSGNTPAYQLERAGKLMLTPFPAPTFPDVDWTKIEIAMSNLAPGGQVTLGPMTLKRALTSDETQSIVNGSHAIYMMGEIRYIDAFKHARTTRFRLLHRGNGKPQYNTVSTIHDAEGNDSD